MASSTQYSTAVVLRTYSVVRSAHLPVARCRAHPSVFSVFSSLASSFHHLPLAIFFSPVFLASSILAFSPLPCQRINLIHRRCSLARPNLPGYVSNRRFLLSPRGRIALANRVQSLLRSASVAPSVGRSIPARSTPIDPSRTRDLTSIGGWHG